MRIAVDGTAAVGGGKVYLVHLLSSLAQLTNAHEFVVFHLADSDETPALSLPGFHFHRVRMPSFAGSHRLAGSILKMFWRLLVLPFHLARFQPDLLFSNAGFAPLYRPPRTKLVLALHNAMPLQDDLLSAEVAPLKRLRLILLRRLLQDTLRHCDCVIVFSEELKRRMRLQMHHLHAELSVVYHGVDWGEAERALPPDLGRLAELGIRPPYLLYVSHFHRYKNVLKLLEAYALVHARHPSLSLVLVGEAPDRAYWKEVQQSVRRLGLGERVKHIGQRPREELKHIYRGAMALVYPSLVENCPFAVLEAFALGLPVAAARASSLPEICGDAAILFDPNSSTRIADVLDQIVSQEALREDLHSKALARAQAFSWPKAARQTLQIFELVGRPPAGRS
jgi:glycosyltransferase involved in cell wall biosynthesis